ncbi:hypothetical protein POVWA2_008720 [Plasmodium ovale wallikeri]|uniref:Uncharacterized protein n=1 Tax=Plasmodium ovale wallikeri TaxID=864142 RepID=A0A1A8YL54_PLAOA|nr:hypothetical protein POVWA2_008720 [Plasmodium ovale wallikeri]
MRICWRHVGGVLAAYAFARENRAVTSAYLSGKCRKGGGEGSNEQTKRGERGGEWAIRSESVAVSNGCDCSTS